MRIALLSMVAACGGHGQSPPPDAPVDMFVPVDAPANLGFIPPLASMRANVEQSPGNFLDAGPADVSCLNTPAADPPTTTTVSLTTTVRDFQSDNVVPGATVDVFPQVMLGSPFAGSPFTANGSGVFSVNLPTGTTLFGFDVTQSSALRTLVLQQSVLPGQASQSKTILSMSLSTAATLPALVGVSRTPGTSLVLAVMRDCQGRQISNFIATVSSFAGMPVHVDGAETFYFSSSVGLPVRHENQAASSADGRFMVIELPPSANANVQVWGFRNDAELAADQLTLIAELGLPMFADTVLAPDLAPLRQ